MKRLTWRLDDKSTWGDGPWQDEPDKIQWKDRRSGFPCLIVRGPVGSLCGYVAVPSTHSAYGKSYDGLDIDVHGGLTFAGRCMTEEEGRVCHVVEPGESDDVWWLGFDTAHGFDLSPKMEAELRSLAKRDAKFQEIHGRLKSVLGGTYKDVHYVKRQVRKLAAQLAAWSPS